MSKLKYALFFVAFAINIGIEFAYRRPLFKKSIKL